MDGMATSRARNPAAWTPCQAVNITAARNKTRKIKRRQGWTRRVRLRTHPTDVTANDFRFGRLLPVEAIKPASKRSCEIDFYGVGCTPAPVARFGLGLEWGIGRT